MKEDLVRSFSLLEADIEFHRNRRKINADVGEIWRVIDMMKDLMAKIAREIPDNPVK